MGTGIQPLTTLTKVQHPIPIIQLHYRQCTILIVTLFSIIQITTEELSEANTDVLLLFDVELVEFLLALLGGEGQGDGCVGGFYVTDD